jgi:hypothetical protein
MTMHCVAVACAAILVFPAAAAPQAPQLPRALHGIDQTFAGFEAAELREGPRRPFIPPDSEEIARARKAIDAQLRKTPDDPATFILAARVGRFALMPLRSASCRAECVLAPGYDDAPVHAAIDRALALQPNEAAAHFWKASLLADGRPVIRDAEFAVDVDSAAVLEHAVRAVALDPGNARYREFLAERYAGAGRYAEAAAAVQPLGGGQHPFYLLLRDFDALPVPDGAVAWTARRGAFMGMVEAPPRYTEHKSRSWAVALALDDVLAFYRRLWPDLRFFQLDVSRGDGKAWLQWFAPDSAGRLQPARDSSFVDDQAWWSSDHQGLLVMVRRAGPAVDQRPVAVPRVLAGRDVFVEIVITSGRHLP